MQTPREMFPPEMWGELHEQYPDVYPVPTLDEQRVISAFEIRKRYAALLSQVATPYFTEERETWPVQLEEANAWLANNTAPTPMLSALALARGISMDILVAKIKENDGILRQAVGALLGQQQKELDGLA